MVITPLPMSQLAGLLRMPNLAGLACAHLLHDCIGLLCLA